MAESAIQDAILKGIHSYSQAKFAYWPANGKADLAEATLVVNIAAALHNAGCHIYAEAQLNGNAREHVDLFALNIDGRWAVALEAKRLFQTRAAGLIAEDYRRLTKMTLPQEWSQLPTPLSCYACLITSCWNAKYAAWWKATDLADIVEIAPLPHHQSAISPLHEALGKAAFRDAIDVQKTGWDPHWITYAIVKLPDNQFSGQLELPLAVTHDSLA